MSIKKHRKNLIHLVKKYNHKYKTKKNFLTLINKLLLIMLWELEVLLK